MDWSPIWPIVTILVGGSSVLTVSVQGWMKWKSGAAGREKAYNADMKTQRDEAIADLEHERDWRRIVSEKAAKWRRIAIEHGVPEEALGPWPSTPPRT